MIYLASPYTHKDRSMRQLRFKLTEAYVARCIRSSERIFSPIVYAHAMAESYEIPFTADYWKEFNNEMILTAQRFRVLTLKGWQESKGVTAEIQLAKSLSKSVEFVAWPE